jgi:hypothetical protein
MSERLIGEEIFVPSVSSGASGDLVRIPAIHHTLAIHHII